MHFSIRLTLFVSPITTSLFVAVVKHCLLAGPFWLEIKSFSSSSLAEITVPLWFDNEIHFAWEDEIRTLSNALDVEQV